MNRRVIFVCFAFLVLVGCGKDGPALHPVRGKVLVNGQPAERVTVAFYHTDSSVKGNAAHPCAVTDENGMFQISTNADKDGAVEGEYLVTFTWWSDADPDRAKDLLGGKYSNEKKSTFRAKVSNGATELPPFELTIDPAQAKKFVK